MGRWAPNHRSKHVKTNNNMHGRTRDNMQCRLLFPSRVLQMTAWRRYGTSKRESDQKPPGILREFRCFPNNGRNFLSSTVRCESRPRAIRPQAARNIPHIFRPDAASTRRPFLQIQIGRHRQHDMRCLPHVLVTLMQLCCVCVSFRQRGVDLTFAYFLTGD